MKRSIGKKGALLSLIVFLAFISGAVTYIKTLQQQPEEKKEAKTAEAHKTNAQEIRIEKVFNIKDILSGVEEIYLESSVGSNEIIEVDDKDVREIIAHMKSLQLEKVETMRADVVYFYMIHIKDKNLKINVSDQYISIDDIQGNTQFFKGKQQQIVSFKNVLETTYMKHYNNYEPFMHPNTIKIEAKDEAKQWILEEKEIKKLLDNIQLVSPVEKEKVLMIPAYYPDYYIHIIKNDKDYGVHLINDEILQINAPDSYGYYRYDSKLWQYITVRYPVQFKSQPDSLKYLLKADKVVVKDIETSFDFEDETYYHKEIPRYLIRAKKEEIKELKTNDHLIYVLKFSIGNAIEEVKVYENQINYREKNYYSPNIGEIIKSILNVP